MKYTIQITDTKTARLIIEWKPRPGIRVRPIALRHCFDEQGCLERLNGALLGFDPIHTCALFLLVRKGDLISVGENAIGVASATWTHYQIGLDFAMNPISIVGPTLTAVEIRALILPNVASYHQPPGDDDALRDFINNPHHPAWLLPILERQKKKWRANRLSKFYHLVPSEVPDTEIPQIVKLAPEAALRFFLSKLTKLQIRSCVRRALTAAIIHAFDHIPPTQFKKAVRDHPSILLTHQGNRLPEDLLLRCVRFEPFVAFNIRKSFPPAIHAKILAATCGLPFGLFRSGDVSQLPTEIAFSFLQYPVQWLETYDNNFSELFRILERHARMKTCHNLIRYLMNSLPPHHLQGLFDFISDNF
jgi:hypothetical protein